MLLCMKKLKPMLLVMIAAFLMFSFSSNAFAASKYVDAVKHEYESHVISEKLYTEGETVELYADKMGTKGQARVYVMFEDLKGDNTTLMSQIFLTPEINYIKIRHKNPLPGYYYIEIFGDSNVFVDTRLKKLDY